MDRRFTLSMPGGRMAALGWPAIVAGALLALLAPVPAGAQPPCAGSGWGRLDVGAYKFSYLSRVSGSGAAASLVHCVRNDHATRGLVVDWRSSGHRLRGPIPPGRPIYTTTIPLGGRVSRRPSSLFYGARPSVLTVPSFVYAGAPAMPFLGSGAATPLLRRAFRAAPAVAPAYRSGANESLIYVPVGDAFFTERQLNSIRKTPFTDRRLVEWIEERPDQLGQLAMTFDNRVSVDGRGGLNVAWKCVYRLIDLPGEPGSVLLFLRFSDPDLHRRMFGTSEPFALDHWAGAEAAFNAGLSSLRPRDVVQRSAELQILLEDDHTVVATIPVTYSGPSAS